MKTLGLDIGTTSICAAVYQKDHGVLEAYTAANDSFLPGESWERIQDPEKILRICLSLVEQILAEHGDINAIGITGQMHGILYLNPDGDPVSPLYTWQDGRGNLPFGDGRSWAKHLTELTGYPAASGYGLVTHYYNLHHGLVPEDAVVLCTIGDFLAMKLSGASRPVMEPSNAASLGLYHLQQRRFDKRAMSAAGMDPAMLPQIVKKRCLGQGSFGMDVYCAIGDNQASFLGATEGKQDAVLVNMGTGGQVSVYSPVYLSAVSLETRPFPDGGWLLVGASLCGGRSYALLEGFFRETVRMVTGLEISAYDAMARALSGAGALSDPPRAVTTFQGTRAEPDLRGSIENLTPENFTPVHIIQSILRGMAEELHGFYRAYLTSGGTPAQLMIGSGNALRRNSALRDIFQQTFGCPMVLSKQEEEAACGAAIYAMTHG